MTVMVRENPVAVMQEDTISTYLATLPRSCIDNDFEPSLFLCTKKCSEL